MKTLITLFGLVIISLTANADFKFKPSYKYNNCSYSSKDGALAMEKVLQNCAKGKVIHVNWRASTNDRLDFISSGLHTFSSRYCDYNKQIIIKDPESNNRYASLTCIYNGYRYR